MSYYYNMALIACIDKQKKHRVKASGNLPRTDYYCPHKEKDIKRASRPIDFVWMEI